MNSINKNIANIIGTKIFHGKKSQSFFLIIAPYLFNM